MAAFAELITQSLFNVWVSFTHNWPFLLASILISVGLKLYLDPHKVAAWITRYRRVGVAGATAAAVTTPFCSCGTTAVILGMVASTMPWSPIVAFMVASPLTSPQELVYSAGLFGWPFAAAFFVSSIVLGLLGGAAADFCESRGWLANQARFRPKMAKTVSSHNSTGGRRMGPAGEFRDIRIHRPLMPGRPVLAAAASMPATGGCCGQAAGSAPVQPANAPAARNKVTLRDWLDETAAAAKQLLPMFLGFAFIGYLLNSLIPQEWVAAVFGAGSIYSVPLAATLGLPLYINTEGSLPLVRALIDNGMSQGAALAFLISGAGTSIGAVAGALTIARWRVIALVVSTLWFGSILLGCGYNLLLAAGLF